MNININKQGFHSFGFGGGLLGGGNGLKSTQQKLERQETRDRQVAFFESQKENLKNVKCKTVEEIARKLELFHSYEDQIKAAKAAYNNEQMWHMMDESQEIGEKIAKAVEKSKPKTAEERQEDLVEEITGTESDGIMEELDEAIDEALELQEKLETEELHDAIEETDPEAIQEVYTETAPEVMQEVYVEASPEAMQKVCAEASLEAMSEVYAGTVSEAMTEIVDAVATETMPEEVNVRPEELRLSDNMTYRPFDYKI